jgi:hypothetical protein
MLLENLRAVGPKRRDIPTVAVLTPGAYNSAYFEHAFLAQQMGVELVEGRTCSSRTTRSTCAPRAARRGARDLPARRRRLPRPSRVPQGLDARRAGPLRRVSRRPRDARQRDRHRRGRRQVDLPLRAGHDPLLPVEEPILNNVPTFMCYKAQERDHVLAHLPDLVVKEVHGAGGYGMLVGPASTTEERARSASASSPTREVHRAADACALDVPDLRRRGHRAAPHRPAAYVLSGADIDLVPAGSRASRCAKGRWW